MIILAVDTSASTSYVCISKNNKIISQCSVTNITHSQTLLPTIHYLLDLANISINDIDIFAIGTGPGSFTGVRIGIATIKGLSMGTQKWCIGISSLDAIAYSISNFEGTIYSIIDAKCGYFYCSAYKKDRKLIKKFINDTTISTKDLEQLLKNDPNNIITIGDIENINSDKIKNNGYENNLYINKSVGMIKYIHKNNITEMTSYDDIFPSNLMISNSEKSILK